MCCCAPRSLQTRPIGARVSTSYSTCETRRYDHFSQKQHAEGLRSRHAHGRRVSLLAPGLACSKAKRAWHLAACTTVRFAPACAPAAQRPCDRRRQTSRQCYGAASAGCPAAAQRHTTAGCTASLPAAHAWPGLRYHFILVGAVLHAHKLGVHAHLCARIKQQAAQIRCTVDIAFTTTH